MTEPTIICPAENNPPAVPDITPIYSSSKQMGISKKKLDYLKSTQQFTKIDEVDDDLKSSHISGAPIEASSSSQPENSVSPSGGQYSPMFGVGIAQQQQQQHLDMPICFQAWFNDKLINWKFAIHSYKNSLIQTQFSAFTQNEIIAQNPIEFESSRYSSLPWIQLVMQMENCQKIFSQIAQMNREERNDTARNFSKTGGDSTNREIEKQVEAYKKEQKILHSSDSDSKLSLWNSNAIVSNICDLLNNYPKIDKQVDWLNTVSMYATSTIVNLIKNSKPGSNSSMPYYQIFAMTMIEQYLRELTLFFRIVRDINGKKLILPGRLISQKREFITYYALNKYLYDFSCNLTTKYKFTYKIDSNASTSSIFKKNDSNKNFLRRQGSIPAAISDRLDRSKAGQHKLENDITNSARMIEGKIMNKKDEEISKISEEGGFYSKMHNEGYATNAQDNNDDEGDDSDVNSIIEPLKKEWKKLDEKVTSNDEKEQEAYFKQQTNNVVLIYNKVEKIDDEERIALEEVKAKGYIMMGAEKK